MAKNRARVAYEISQFDCLSITRNTRKPHSLRRFASRTIAFVALICQFHHQLSNCWAELAIDVFLRDGRILDSVMRSEEHTSELQSLMRISYAVFCFNKNKHNHELN